MKIRKFENIDFDDWDIQEEEPSEFEGKEFDTYIHGSKGEGWDILRTKFDISDYPKPGEKEKRDFCDNIIYINYEIKIVYKIIDGKPRAISVNFGDGRGDVNIE